LRRTPDEVHPIDISREGLLGARRRDVVLAPRGRGHMRRWIIPGGIALFALALGCHHEVEMVPLAERTIYVTDRFYDVQALTKDRAFVLGDGGKTWRARKVAMEADIAGGESLAAADPILYDVKFVDATNGWIVGEFGKIMHTADGGETWHEQEKTLMEGTGIFDPLDLPTLYGLYAKDQQQALAAGLEGHIARTSDGGQRWSFEQIEGECPLGDPLLRVTELPG